MIRKFIYKVRSRHIMEEHFVTVDGNKIRYLEYGSDKENLVLVHGLGASAERWASVSPILEKHYRLIVPDLIGFGLSDKPLVDYTSEFFAEFLGKFLDEVDIAKTHIVGSSLGGQVVANYVAENSSKIKKLVLVSPSGVMKSSTPALDAYVMAALYPTEESAKNAFLMMSGGVEEIPKKIVHGFIERMQMPNAKMAFMSTLLGLKNAKVITEKLPAISVPTLLVWGAKDPVIPIEYSENFLSSLNGCQFYKMHSSGHTPYVDNPEEFAKNVLDFLNK